MKKKVWIASIFFFIFILLEVNKTCSQVIHLPAEVDRIVTSYCPVCKKNSLDSNKQITAGDEFPAAPLAYHNAIVLLKNGSIDDCYQYLNACLNEKSRLADSVYTIALFLKGKILYYKSLYKEALQIYTPLLDNNQLNKAVKENICTNIAETYLAQNDFIKALNYFSIWDSVYRLYSNSNSISGTYCNIGSCYLHINQFDKAHDYFEKSIAIANEFQDTSLLAIAYDNIANQYYNQYLDKKALPYFLQSLSLAKISGNLETQMNVIHSLSVVEEGRKHYPESLEYMKQYAHLKDSLFNRDDIYNLVQKEKTLAVKEKDHQVQIVQQANKLQSLEIAKNNLEISKQKQFLFLLIVLAVVFLSFFLFAFYAYRIKTKQNAIISAQREELDALNHTKDQLFSVVAHDLRSPVQTLRVTLNKLKTSLHNKNISEAEQVSGEIESISNGTYSLLNNLLYWALSQTGQLHFTKEKLNACRLVEQVFYDYAAVAEARHVGLVNQVPDNLYCSSDANTVKIMLRNLTDNAIKYSEPFTSVTVSGTCEHEECILSVTNRGKGIDEAIIRALRSENTRRVESEKGQSTGIGLWLVKTMAERNGGSLRIERQVQGTKIDIHLPQYQHHEQAADTYS